MVGARSEESASFLCLNLVSAMKDEWLNMHLQPTLRSQVPFLDKKEKQREDRERGKQSEKGSESELSVVCVWRRGGMLGLCLVGG